MLVITGQKYESILVGDKAKTMVVDVCGSNGCPGITRTLAFDERNRI
ncbi:MAG: hypothetical protein ACYS8I_12270 [Planctomycetota bacterium]|jgi:sRNA-binding carbon storage regulator CsrA